MSHNQEVGFDYEQNYLLVHVHRLFINIRLGLEPCRAFLARYQQDSS